MKATELLDSIHLLHDYGMYKEARLLFRRVRGREPDLFTAQGWAELEAALPKAGVHKGFKHKIVQCPECGGDVKDNWIIRHLKSGCKVGRR